MKISNIIKISDLESTYPYFIPKSKINLAKKWLPLNLDSNLAKEFAYVLGKSFGDGHLDKNYTFKHAGEHENQKLFEKLLVKRFKLSQKSIKLQKNNYSKGNSTFLQVNMSVFGRILFLLGCPIGNKVKQEFFVPEWIISNKQNSKYFLQGFLEDELAIIKIKKMNHCNGGMLKMAKIPILLPSLRIFLKQIKEMIKMFDVECGSLSKKVYFKENQKTREVYFRIKTNKKNVLKFRNKIGFRIHNSKKKELENCYKKISAGGRIRTGELTKRQDILPRYFP